MAETGHLDDTACHQQIAALAAYPLGHEDALPMRRWLIWRFLSTDATLSWSLLCPILNDANLITTDDVLAAIGIQQTLLDTSALEGLARLFAANNWPAIQKQWQDWLVTQGDYFRHDGDYIKAIGLWHCVSIIAPDYPDVWMILSEIYRRLERWQDEAACLEQALALRPDAPDLLLQYGHVLHRFHNVTGALEAHQRAYAQAPEDPEIISALEFTARRAGDWDIVAKLSPSLALQSQQALQHNRTPGELPFQCVFRYETDAIINPIINAWATHFGQIPDAKRINAPITMPDPNRCLRIGYLSGDFYDHATMHLLGGIFAGHDRTNFQVIGLSCGRVIDDHYRRAAQQACDEFIDLYGLGDYALARAIAAANIDILIDLKGMTGRLYHLACRPAPIIASWIGFPGTTGADYIDYLIADDILIADDVRPLYKEKIAFMPVCYQLTDNRQYRAPPSPRSDSFPDVPDDAVILGSFCHSLKINPDVWDAWLDILTQAPRAYLALMIPASLPHARARLIATMTARNLDPARLIFLSAVPKLDHLKRIGHLDLSLDTWPCGGHTTTTDALWAGVPVLSRRGGHFAGRVAESILQAAGLASLVAPDRASYISKAVALVMDDAARQQYRAALNDPLSLPLFRTADRLRELETLYRQMWQRACAGLPPDDLRIKVC